MNKAHSFTHCSACSTEKERWLFIYYLSGWRLHSADPQLGKPKDSLSKFLTQHDRKHAKLACIIILAFDSSLGTPL